MTDIQLTIMTAISRAYQFYDESGDWDGDQLIEVLKPLHEAILNLTKEKKSEIMFSADGHYDGDKI